MTVDAYVKRDRAAPPRFFAAEARGLGWLREARDGAAVVDVLDVDEHSITLERLTPTSATAPAAHAFGQALARTHQAPDAVWGRNDGDGFIGPLPLPNGPYESWPHLYWTGRVEPYLRRAQEASLLDRDEVATIGEVVTRRCADVPAPQPSRIHGDLWSGNVVWTRAGAVLIDAAAAHGGHLETDLAMLALFGLAHLDTVLAGYAEETALAAGWSERVPLMQVHPLLVHVVLFGGGYVGALRAAVAALR